MRLGGEGDGGDRGLGGSTGKLGSGAGTAGIARGSGRGEELVAALMGGEAVGVEAEDFGEGEGGLGGEVELLEEEGAMPVEGPVVGEGTEGEVQVAEGEVVATDSGAAFGFAAVPGGDCAGGDFEDGAPAVGAIGARACG